MKGETPASGDAPANLLFQSTLPMKGETTTHLQRDYLAGISIHSPNEGRDLMLFFALVAVNISIHSPNEGRDRKSGTITINYTISIHSPNEGRDQYIPPVQLAAAEFQSTLPMKGETSMAGSGRATT